MIHDGLAFGLQSKQLTMPQAAQACFSCCTQSSVPARLPKSGWKGRTCEQMWHPAAPQCCSCHTWCLCLPGCHRVAARWRPVCKQVWCAWGTHLLMLLISAFDACQAAEERWEGGVPSRPWRSVARRHRQGQQTATAPARDLRAPAAVLSHSGSGTHWCWLHAVCACAAVDMVPGEPGPALS